jgi:hypothetical protein
MNDNIETTYLKEEKMSVAEGIDKILSWLGTLLRYIAPGFVFLIFARIAGFTWYGGLNEKELVVGGILIGVLLYAIQSNFLSSFLWYRIIIFLLNRRWRLDEDLKVNQWPRNTMKHLDFSRWRRRGSENKEIQSIQKEMDKWGALLNFLYCSAYAAIIIFFIALAENQISKGAKLDLGIGIFLLLCAVTSEYRQTDYEIILYYDPSGKDIRSHKTVRELFWRKKAEQKEETSSSEKKQS